MQAASRSMLFRCHCQLSASVRVRVPACSMYTNPYTKKFKVKPSPGFEKQTTGLTALNVSEHPHNELTTIYNRILHTLSKMPQTSVYRQHTEKLVQQRLDIVKNEPDIRKMEEKIGMGQIEEVIEQAQYEMECARDMLRYEVWEPLCEQPPPKQWAWPV